MPSTGPTQIASGADRPRLAPHVRLTFDPARERHVLLTPESVTVLNGTAAAVLPPGDGERPQPSCACATGSARWPRSWPPCTGTTTGWTATRCDCSSTASPHGTAWRSAVASAAVDRPFGLLAELTYGCPLHCPYCSNPLDLGAYRDELTTAEWQRVLADARELGVLQLHLSGGEPLLRRDLAEIVRTASELGQYTNLITSGLGLTPRRAEQLRAAGLDHVQISVQADEAILSDRLAGTPSFGRKLAAARLVKKLGWPLTLNVVLHRHNVDRIARILELAEELEADRIELANTQYYGWALLNRNGLLPSRAPLEHAGVVVRAARERLQGQMDVIYVLPDYYSRYPKPCMGGWGRRQLTVVPDGDVLP